MEDTSKSSKKKGKAKAGGSNQQEQKALPPSFSWREKGKRKGILPPVLNQPIVSQRASGGIGAETARVFAMRGVHVIIGVRNVVAGGKVKEAIVKEIPSAKVEVMELDLSSLASVRKFASDYDSSGFPLNILINNAGIMGLFWMRNVVL